MLDQVHVPPLSLRDYAGLAGEDAVEEIRQLAEPLRGARVLHVNATKFGGGVAELLPTLTALMNDVGLAAEWRIMPGSDDFFAATKSIHNALQGATGLFNGSVRAAYEEGAEALGQRFEDGYDFVVMHDPQPLALRSMRPDAGGTWIWRCHIDLTDADPQIWDYVRPKIDVYDAAIFTMREYAKPDLKVPVIAIVPPSIDPRSPKNVTIERHLVEDVVHRLGLDPVRPLLLQVSRFDPWKDPIGVIDTYRAVKKQIRGVQLALIGSMATDDPEGWRIYQRVLRYAGQDEDLLVVTNLDGVGNLEVNAFQRASEVVLQKSIREGFGLTVSEALWKEIPVVGGRVGGIPMQIGADEAGRLVTTVDEAVAACLELLESTDLRVELGRAGHERVRHHFLSTRNLRDYLALFTALREDRPELVPTGVPVQASAG